jgi:hypothetical protein
MARVLLENQRLNSSKNYQNNKSSNFKQLNIMKNPLGKSASLVALVSSSKENRSTYMNNLLKSVQGKLVALYERWQDEKQYEDFEEYKKVLEAEVLKHSPISNTQVKSIDKKFNITLVIPGFIYEVIIIINSKQIGWKAGNAIGTGQLIAKVEINSHKPNKVTRPVETADDMMKGLKKAASIPVNLTVKVNGKVQKNNTITKKGKLDSMSYQDLAKMYGSGFLGKSKTTLVELLTKAGK